MEIVSSAEFQKGLGYFQDRALIEPIVVTRNGRERLVLLSVDEYRRLKHLDRESLAAADLSDEELSDIEKAEVPAEYSILDSDKSK